MRGRHHLVRRTSFVSTSLHKLIRTRFVLFVLDSVMSFVGHEYAKPRRAEAALESEPAENGDRYEVSADQEIAD